MFGVDILIKENGQPYVVELNASPSIETNNPVADGNVLKQVYRDTWGMGVTRLGRRGERRRRRRSTGRVKEWMLRSAAVGLLRNVDEDEALIQSLDQWCRRSRFDLALAPLDDFEVVGSYLDREWRLSKAMLGVLEVLEESEICLD